MEQQKIKGVNVPTTTEAGKVEKEIQEERAKFKNVADMSKEEILALPVCPMKLMAKKTNKDKREYYTLTFSPHLTLTIQMNVQQAMYYILLEMFGIQAQYNSYNLNCHYRIVRAERSNGNHSGNVFDGKSYYYYFEGIVNKKVVFRSFLTDVQIMQIKVTGLYKTLHIVDRPVVDEKDVFSNIDDIAFNDAIDEEDK